jgi:glycosyltransferase involved in cell wall biosynthesis
MPGRGWDGSRFERAHLRAALLALRPQIVHAHWAYEYALAALRSGGPHLVSCHDLPHEVTAEQTLWRSRLWRWLCERQAARVMKRARALTAPSPWLAEALTGQARVPVTVLPNMVSMGPADAAPAERPRALAGRWRVLMANNGFGLRKNVGAGLEAFARLARQRPGAELVLLGEDMGPGQAAERWWRARGLDAGRGPVRFVGAQSHAVVQHWMRQSDVLLHPALQETFGMAVAEALALGLPVVAGHASGALPWLAGELAGTQVRLVDVRSPEAMAEALQALALGRESDSARAAAWSAAAQRSMRERFAPPRVGDALEALYRRALAEQG